MEKSIGTFYGISVGTGDPELITIKGLKILQKVTIIAFPAGKNHESGLAEQIISPWVSSQQEKLPLNFPYVQDQSQLQQAWQQAAQQVWEYLKKGIDVAFACEGDVSFYSTFTYVAQTLLDTYPHAIIETVPGVCSPMAVASVLKMPLTLHSQRLTVLPALYRVSELEQVLTWADVVVLLKVSSVYNEVWQILKRLNLLDQAWIVERATQPTEKIYKDLGDRPHLSLSYFSLLIIKVNSFPSS